ncbi:MAG: iron ABC transporter permease [Bacteroidota bacterium]
MRNFPLRHIQRFVGLGILLAFFFVLDIAIGSVTIPPSEIVKALFGFPEVQESWSNIVWKFRLPRTITALIAGAGLAISGLLMQTLFRNPIAGPFVLGISSGASLGVAILVLATGWVASFLPLSPMSSWSMVLAATFGSFLVLLIVLSVSWRVRDIATLLIVGLMIGSATSALVTVLEYFSDKESLKRFILWGMGSLTAVTWKELNLLIPIVFAGLVWTFFLSKSLNVLLIGEDYAMTSGLNIKRARYQVIAVTAILAGSITAFCGPIAFIGIAIPHFARMVFRTQQHQVLIPATIITGMVVLIFCDILAQLPFFEGQLPINAITSLMGAPIVIWIVLNRRSIGSD